MADLHRNLFFDEDQCDLVCSLEDTLLKLEFPTDAEHCLRTEITRQAKDRVPIGPPLKLALAESLFAQERYTEAETFCSEVQSQEKLLKMEKLRLAILRAKLSHVSSNWEEAFCQ